MDGLLLSREIQNTVINKDIVKEIIKESKGLNKVNKYRLDANYLDDGIEFEVGVSFDEFYKNTADIFEITGFNDIFHFDDDY